MTAAESDRLWQQSVDHFSTQNLSAAREALQQYVAKVPANAEAWSNLGYLNYLLGDLDAAQQHCAHAIELDADFVAAYSNYGLSLYAAHNYQMAETQLLEGIRRDATQADLWTNLGLVYLAGNRVAEAIDACHKALTIDPASVNTRCNLALCLLESGRSDKALVAYQQANQTDPAHPAALSNRLLTLQYQPGVSSAYLKRTAVDAARHLRPAGSPSAIDVAARDKPAAQHGLRSIGFISSDFRAHPVGWFLREVMPHLAASGLNIYCYANQSRHDAVTDELKAHASRWHACFGMSTEQKRALIHADQPDVIIDLAGHTAGNDLALFASRNAPLQLSWLGYPATTGLAEMDAVVLSTDLMGQSAAHYFSERIIPLNAPQFVYRPPDFIPPVAAPPCIKNGYITFGSFNNLAKLNDSVLQTWAHLLHAVPRSRLVLKWKTLADSAVQLFFLKRFHSLGITADRLDLRPASEHPAMFAEYGDLDIALDPFPFSGALTSFEAVWMGVPVVTLYSERPLSRQTYSINKSLGLLHLCATTPAEYLAAAHRLASDVDALQQLRATQRTRIADSPLTDGEGMAQHFIEGLRGAFGSAP